MKRTYADHLDLVMAAMEYVYEREYEIWVESPFELPYAPLVERDAMVAEVVYTKDGADFKPLRKFSPWARATGKLFRAVRVVTPTREWFVWEEPHGLYGEW